MALEFQPPFRIDPYAETQSQRSLGNLNNTISNIGDQAQRYGQQSFENKRQQALLALQQQQSQREQGAYNYEYGNPSSGPGEVPSIAPTQTGPQGYEDPSRSQSMPLPSPSSPPSPGTDLTSHFQAWQSQGQPPQYNHPDLGGGQPQQSFGPGLKGQVGSLMNQYMQSVNNPKVGAKQRGDLLEGAKGAASIFKETGDQSYATPDQANAILGAGNEPYVANLGKQYGGNIPIGIVKDAQTALNQKRMAEQFSTGQANTMGRFNNQQADTFSKSLDPNSMRGGVMGVLQRKINSADALDALYQQTGGNPTPQQMQELVLGTANMLSNGGLAAEGTIQGLLPKSFKGDIMAGAQWLRNQPLGAEQQAFAKNLHDTMMREKSVAERQLKTAQLQDASAWQGRVDPSTYNQVISARGLQGYQMGQNGQLIEPQQTQAQSAPITAVNRKTGQRIQSTDGGKTWTIAQ